MERREIAAQIWGGSITEEETKTVSPLAGLLGSLTNAPVVTLASASSGALPQAFVESTEVLPGVNLGDMLAEELGLEIPYGAVILVQPRGFARMQDYSGQKLGELLGQVILTMTQDIPNTESDVAAMDHMGPLAALAGFAASGASRLQ